METTELFKKTIEKWGERSQFEMAQEEATELALACRKFIRQPTNDRLDELAGEIADVEIMIEQLKLMQSKLPKLVEEQKVAKLKRLERRVTNNQYEGEEKTLREKALDWWQELVEDDAYKEMEVKHGVYGHDIGITEDDVINMYKAEVNG